MLLASSPCTSLDSQIGMNSHSPIWKRLEALKTLAMMSTWRCPRCQRLDRSNERGTR